MADISVVQSGRLANQVGKAVGEALQGKSDGPITVNVHLNQNQQVHTQEMNVGKSVTTEQVLAYIETFPQPRLRNFLEHLYYLVGRKTSKEQAAEWLGVNARTLYRNRYASKQIGVVPGVNQDGTPKKTIARYSKTDIENALKENDWVQARAAYSRGIHPTNFGRLVHKFGITPPDEMGKWSGGRSGKKMVESHIEVIHDNLDQPPMLSNGMSGTHG